MSYRHLLAGAGAAVILSLGTTLPVQAQTHVGNVVIDGSLCVGFDCPVSPSFSDATILLMENNTRIKFGDTSSTASFPRTDWELEANSQSNGGPNRFSIFDCGENSNSGGCGGSNVFSVEAGAGSNALYVDDGGRVGFGTSTPVLELHIKDGDTPSIRLEQDNTSGFTPQTWDVAGNETNFFVRDATGGSALPFRIQPGTGSNTLFLDSDELVGIGTSAPTVKLHVNAAAAAGALIDTNALNGLVVQGDGAKNLDLVSDTGGALQMRLVSNTGTRNIVALDTPASAVEVRIAMQNNRILLTGPDAVADEWLRVSATGIETPGTVTSGGPTCSGGCDAVFDRDAYVPPSIEDHAALMWENGFLPAVGPTLPGAPMNVTEKIGTMLNELEHAHIYIEQLHKRIETLEQAIADKG